MFFNLSKILWPLLAPLNLIFILTLLATCLILFKKIRAGTALLVFACILFMAAGLLPLGYNAIAWLENTYKTPDSLPPHIAGIIVLGGAFETGISLARGQPHLNNGVERVLDALYLARRYPSAMVIFSGGEGKLQPAGHPEAQDVRDFLERQGLAYFNAVYEEESRNTYQNAVYTKELMLPQPDEHWILVTSAYHMPRAMAVFKSQGWQNLVPWVTDYRTTGRRTWLPRRLNIAGNISMAELALHEYLGHLIYRLTGKISLP